MIETDILQALQTSALAAFNVNDLKTVLNWDETTHVKVIGRTFTPPSDGNYLEFAQVVNNRPDDYFGSERVYQGSFRIILHWMPDDEGAYKLMRYIDQLGDFFPKDKLLQSGQATVKIYENPSASGVIENGSEL